MNPYEAQQLTTRLRLMSPAELSQFGEMHKADPNVFPLVFNESNFRKSMLRNQQMQQAQQGAAPPVNEQALSEMRAPTSAMPEDVGIAQLPTGDMQFANGGIVAFADGGGTRGDPVQEFATKYRPLAEKAGAELGVDPGLIIAQWGHETGWGSGVPGRHNLGNIKDFSKKGTGTKGYDRIEGSRSRYRDYESPEAFVQDYVSQIKRNWPEAMGTKGDVAAFTQGLQKGRLGAYATDPKYASKMAGVAPLLPIGSAQAAAPTPAAADAAFVPTVKVGEGYTPEGLEALGQRLDAIRAGVKNVPSAGLQQLRTDPEAGARYAAAQQLRRDAEAEYQQYAGKLGLDKPAFMKPSPTFRSVVADATPVAKQLAPDALTPKAPTTAAASAAPVAAAPDFADSQGSIENARSSMQPKPDLSAAAEKKVVAAAKQAAPDDVDTSGFTREDWLTLGFSLLSSKSPRFVEALGESGLKMVAGRQARMKAGQDERKIRADIAQSEAQTRYYDALAGRTDDENKPLAQYRKEVAAALLKLEANPMLSLNPAKMAAAKREKIAETQAQYPELAEVFKSMPVTSAAKWSATSSG